MCWLRIGDGPRPERGRESEEGENNPRVEAMGSSAEADTGRRSADPTWTVRNTSTTGPPIRARPLSVKVWGDFACFTRPDMKAERVSYPVMTPSAARGILEAIFWQPEFKWAVKEIVVLKPIRYFSILRNEVRSKAVFRTAAGWMESGTGQYTASEDRTQRHTLAIRDVAYIVRAQVVAHENGGAHPARYRDQFRRRVKRGACFAAPYLGCREFAASFGPVDGSERPINASADLGRMLLDLRYDTEGRGRPTPMFFDARLERGIMRVPDVQPRGHD